MADGAAELIRRPRPDRVKQEDSGALAGRDVELQLDLLGDQHAAGLERGVPGQVPVLAVDRGRTLEADAQVAEGVTRRAGGLELEGDRLRDALDGQVAGDQPG